jgi:hypothetical protein
LFWPVYFCKPTADYIRTPEHLQPICPLPWLVLRGNLYCHKKIFVILMAMIRRFITVALAVLVLCLAPAVTAQAATYSCGTYGASTYQDGTCASATAQQPAQLENTGQKLLALLLPAIFILAGTGTLLFLRRKKSPKPVAEQDDAP